MIYATKTFRTALWLMLAAQLLIVLYSWLATESMADALQTATRLSGRLSLALFSWLVIIHLRDQNYKGVFLIFAVAHGIHMVELISYQYQIGNVSNLISPRVAGGMLAYTFIYAMPLIHSQSGKLKLSERVIIKIEYLYLFFIWVVFVMAYIPRLFGTNKVYGGSYFEFVILFTWLIVLLVWKVIQLSRAGKIVHPGS